MVRIPRRTHSVSGPPTVHCMWKDVACCCNMAKIQHFYTSMMALRRNPQRRCKKGEGSGNQAEGPRNSMPIHQAKVIDPTIAPALIQLDSRQPEAPSTVPVQTFRFFDLPREVRDHVYSYLVIRRGKRIPIIEAKAILRGQKKRVAAQRTRHRLNLKRIQNGHRPITPRELPTEPVVHLNLLQASRQLRFEAGDYLYQNWFAISLDSFPITTIDTPYGWNFSRINKLQLELQLKDAQRMNNYIDWTTFFSVFPSLRFLRIIPTFHPRYYDWAHVELRNWSSAHFIFRAFFRELMAAIPDTVQLKLGPSINPDEDMQLEGRAPVPKQILQHMYYELAVRNDGQCNEERCLAVSKTVDMGLQAYLP